MPAILDKILRAGEGKILRHLHRIAAQVNSVEEDFAALSDAELRAETDAFRKRLADGQTLKEAGVKPDDQLLLRPSKVKGG